MRQRSFVERRQEGWRRLEAVLAATERRALRRADPAVVAELGRLYRWAAADLAYADGRNYDADLRAYLNRLTARAHARVYAHAGDSGASRLWKVLIEEFPREIVRSRAAIGLCVALFVGASVLAYGLVAHDPRTAYGMVPAQYIATMKKSLHDSNFAVDPGASPIMSSLIITNNVRVAAIAFAGGVTGGILTLFIILQNGLMVGALGALFTRAGFGLDFWATIAPHGVLELTAIQISGGAGLVIAAGFFAPGRLRRADAVKRNGRRAAVLLVGVAAMLIVAGIIEGFFSPLRFVAATRLAFGGATALLLLTYFALSISRTLQHAPVLDVDVSVDESQAELGSGDVEHNRAVRA